MNAQEAKFIAEHDLGHVFKRIRKAIENDKRYVEIDSRNKDFKGQPEEIARILSEKFGYQVDHHDDYYEGFNPYQTYDVINIYW